MIEITLGDVNGNHHSVIGSLMEFPCHHFGRSDLFNRITDDAKHARFTVDEVDLVHKTISLLPMTWPLRKLRHQVSPFNAEANEQLGQR